MKSILTILTVLIASVTLAQNTELTVTVKSIGTSDEEGTQVPYITYLNESGDEQYFNFILPEVGMEEYAVIMIGEEVLFKVDGIDRYGDNPGDKRIQSYVFNDELAKKLIGKKVKLLYTPVQLINYLYSIELTN